MVLPGEELSFNHPPSYAPAVPSTFRPRACTAVGDATAGHIQSVRKGGRGTGTGLPDHPDGLFILRQDEPMVYHVMKPRTKSEQDEKAGYFTGVGQISPPLRFQQHLMGPGQSPQKFIFRPVHFSLLSLLHGGVDRAPIEHPLPRHADRHVVVPDIAGHGKGVGAKFLVLPRKDDEDQEHRQGIFWGNP